MRKYVFFLMGVMNKSFVTREVKGEYDTFLQIKIFGFYYGGGKQSP